MAKYPLETTKLNKRASRRLYQSSLAYGLCRDEAINFPNCPILQDIIVIRLSYHGIMHKYYFQRIVLTAQTKS